MHCGRPCKPPFAIAARPDGARWVRVECWFQCRACGFKVPLNHLDMDGGVLCVRCGLEQAFDVARWRQALGHAHDVADHPFTQALLVTEGVNAFEITARAGHPLCNACHAPVTGPTGRRSASRSRPAPPRSPSRARGAALPSRMLAPFTASSLSFATPNAMSL